MTIAISFSNHLHSTQWGLESLFKLLDTFAFDDEDFQPVLLIFKPLLERQKTDLEKIEEVIYRTLGEISITVCRHYMKVDGKTYDKGDYLKAELKQPRPKLEGGEA